MNSKITMGSLFDGIGGFPLAALKNQINPVWASEIEPFPIAITREHFPSMKHLGNIFNINGKKIPNVDIVTAGSPCQDLSIAGNRAGLSGERSSLFMEMIRVIKEMRENDRKQGKSDTEIRPRILLWENVPGVFSSNKGEDFRRILEEICRIKVKTTSIPMPSKGKWQKSGYILGRDFSLAWRVLNAQYFGVAQRRRRVFLVADFGGQSAPKILFEQCSMSGNTSKSTKKRENSAIGCETSIGKTSKDINRKYSKVAKNNTFSVLPFDTSFCTYLNSHSNPKYGDPCHTLSAHSHIPKIAINHKYYPKDKNVYCLATSQVNSEIMKNLSPTLTASAGTSGNNKPWIMDMSHADDVIRDCGDVSSTFMSSMGMSGNRIPIILNGRSKTLSIRKNKSNTLMATDYKGVQCVFNPVYSIDREGFNQGKNALFDFKIRDNKTSPLIARGPSAVYNPCEKNFIRKLTPLECERLQGFPDFWTIIKKKESMDEEEYNFWIEVYKNHKEFIKKPVVKSIKENFILNWYNKLDSDSARYKAIGNSVAVPCVYFIMERIKKTVYEEREQKCQRE